MSIESQHLSDVERADRDFLIKYAGLSEADFSDEHIAHVDAEIARSRAEVEQLLIAESWGIDRVATFLNLETEDIQRAVAEGSLYAFTSTTDDTLRFPRWQFSATGRLSGLQEVVHALPTGHHPFAVRNYMTLPDDDLEGNSPVRWLDDGRDLGPVLELLTSLNWI